MCFKKKKKKKLKANVISLEILTMLLILFFSPLFEFHLFIYHTIANLQFQFQSSMITLQKKGFLGCV